MTLNQAIGISIKLARQSQGLSQEEIGASQSFVSDIERGKKSMTIQRLEEFANRLGLQPASLMIQASLIADPKLSLDNLLDVVRKDMSRNI